jgi:hypothetical protein
MCSQLHVQALRFARLWLVRVIVSDNMCARCGDGRAWVRRQRRLRTAAEMRSRAALHALQQTLKTQTHVQKTACNLPHPNHNNYSPRKVFQRTPLFNKQHLALRQRFLQHRRYLAVDCNMGLTKPHALASAPARSCGSSAGERPTRAPSA